MKSKTAYLIAKSEAQEAWHATRKALPTILKQFAYVLAGIIIGLLAGELFVLAVEEFIDTVGLGLVLYLLVAVIVITAYNSYRQLKGKS